MFYNSYCLLHVGFFWEYLGTCASSPFSCVLVPFILPFSCQIRCFITSASYFYFNYGACIFIQSKIWTPRWPQPPKSFGHNDLEPGRPQIIVVCFHLGQNILMCNWHSLNHAFLVKKEKWAQWNWWHLQSFGGANVCFWLSKWVHPKPDAPLTFIIGFHHSLKVNLKRKFIAGREKTRQANPWVFSCFSSQHCGRSLCCFMLKLKPNFPPVSSTACWQTNSTCHLRKPRDGLSTLSAMPGWMQRLTPNW